MDDDISKQNMFMLKSMKMPNELFESEIKEEVILKKASFTLHVNRTIKKGIGKLCVTLLATHVWLFRIRCALVLCR